MMGNHSQRFVVLVLTLLTLGLPGVVRAEGFSGEVRDALGLRFDASPHHRNTRGRTEAMTGLRHWNEVAINSSGLDHTPVAIGEDRVFGEQLGPGRSSRAMAIAHIAIFDAVNAIAGRYQSYTGLPAAPRGTSMEAAIAQAAHDTLVALFPSQTARLDAELVSDLGGIRNGRDKTTGIDLGARAAAAILALRADDGS